MLTRTLRADAIQAREADDGTATISGVAVPWDDPIVYGGIREQFARGAIDPQQAVGQPLLMNHDRGKHIGVITAAEDTERGLEVEATIQPTSDGRDAMLLLRSGALRGLSVGFEPMDRDQNPTGVTYTRAHLHELSTTPLQAYPNAQVTEARHEETPTMADTAAPDTATARDLAPDVDSLQARVDQLEARASAPTAPPAPVVQPRDALAMAVREFASTGQRRALADVVSSGNAGILPPDWDRAVLNVLDTRRPVIGASGSTSFPVSGMTKDFPKVTQNTLVGARGTEKTEVPTQALTTATDQFTAGWFAGAVDVAIELIEQSDPSVVNLVVSDMLAQYAIATETAHAGAAETAATSHGAVLDTSSYGAFINDIILIGTDIEAATGKFGDQLACVKADWIAILGLLDGDNRRVFATQGSTNADGSAGLAATSINVGGVNVFYSPRSTVTMQFNDVSLLAGEKAPQQLTSVNVALAGRDYGVLGGLLSVPRIAAGIIKYAV